MGNTPPKPYRVQNFDQFQQQVAYLNEMYVILLHIHMLFC